MRPMSKLLRHSRTALLAAVSAALFSSAKAQESKDRPPNPWKRTVISDRVETRWEFEDSLDGWRIEKHAETISTTSFWKLRSTGIDPILRSPRISIEQRAAVVLRMKTDAAGPGQIFWMSEKFPHASEDRRTQFDAEADGQWREYRIECPFDLDLSQIRIDPATSPGSVEIDWIQIERQKLHPLAISELRVEPDAIRATVENHAKRATVFTHAGKERSLGPGASVKLVQPLPTASPRAFEQAKVALITPGLPPVSRTAVVHNPDAKTDWLRLNGGRLTVDVAPDGSGARILHNRELVGVIAPLVWDRVDVPKLTTVGAPTASAITFRGDGVKHLKLSIVAGELRMVLRADQDFEGPVVRAFGKLQQGLLPGVEHLGRNESSSSTLDIHGPEHIRYEPAIREVTMPLMACVTDKASIGILWWGNRPQPVFATPNFFENTPDHRMALKGSSWNAIIRVEGPFAKGARLAEFIRWGVKKSGGFPKVPQPPRSHADQLAYCLESLNHSEIKGANGGWHHALIPGVKYSPQTPRFFADHLSTLYRLNGEIPQFPELVPGGAHIDNDAIYFVAGRTKEWLERQKRVVRQIMVAQRPDGSFRYGGKYREGHFEDTSSGQCARPAWQLLMHAKRTGDESALRAGIRTLEFMKRFRTPRGAQIWECPLHAPDILAAAYLVKAYTVGYELTQDEEYLKLAARWALTGVPYVYQWGDRPIMKYATIATLCATHWKAPVWIGRPVQWCGLVYADALLDLAPHDSTLKWRQLAEGILISGEQQQYTGGPSKGLLADSLILSSQKLLPYDINPCALVSLRLRLRSQPAGLETAVGRVHRVVAPFPVSIEDEIATVKAKKGTSYQVLIDGERIVEIQSQGVDRISLSNPLPGL